MTNAHIDSASSSETETKIKVSKDGHITFGIKRFRSHAGTIRRQIIELIATNANGHLLKRDYERELVSGHFIQSPNRELRLVSEPYMKRQNNVEKALSRLRQDLANFFQEDSLRGLSGFVLVRKSTAGFYTAYRVLVVTASIIGSFGKKGQKRQYFRR